MTRLKRPAATPVEKFEAASLAVLRGDEKAAAELGLGERSVARYRAEVQSDPASALELATLVSAKRQQMAEIILNRVPEAATRIMGLIVEGNDGKLAQSLAVAFGIMVDKASGATAHTTNSGRFGSSGDGGISGELLERRTMIMETLRQAAAPQPLVLALDQPPQA